MRKKIYTTLLAGIVVALAAPISAGVGAAIESANATTVQSEYRIKNSNLPVEGVPASQIASHRVTFMQNGSCISEVWQLPIEYPSINEFKASSYNGISHANASADAVIGREIQACKNSASKASIYTTTTNNRILMDAPELEM